MISNSSNRLLTVTELVLSASLELNLDKKTIKQERLTAVNTV